MNCMSALEGIDNELDLDYQNVANQAGVVLDELAWAGLWMDVDNNGWQGSSYYNGDLFFQQNTHRFLTSTLVPERICSPYLTVNFP